VTEQTILLNAATVYMDLLRDAALVQLQRLRETRDRLSMAQSRAPMLGTAVSFVDIFSIGVFVPAIKEKLLLLPGEVEKFRGDRLLVLPELPHSLPR
jgi:hypothetical protein